MAVDRLKIDRDIREILVQRVFGRDGGVVAPVVQGPAHAGDPFHIRMLFVKIHRELHTLSLRRRLVQPLHFQRTEAVGSSLQMRVAVAEARHDQLAAEIKYAGIGTDELADHSSRTDEFDLIPADGDAPRKRFISDRIEDRLAEQYDICHSHLAYSPLYCEKKG